MVDDTQRARLAAVIVNRDPKVRGPYTAFADVAGAYERGRPGYPEEAVRWLVGDEPSDVVDLGAGTGKLTRALVALGHRVTAVEPLDEMRAELASPQPDVRALAGSAEAMPLPDGSADVVVVGAGVPLVRPRRRPPRDRARASTGGHLALVWNSRDDRDPWMAQLSAIIGNETIEEWDVIPILQEGGLFGPVETARFSFVQVRDRESCSTSSSLAATARSSPSPSASRCSMRSLACTTTRRVAKACGSRTSPSASGPLAAPERESARAGRRRRAFVYRLDIRPGVGPRSPG